MRQYKVSAPTKRNWLIDAGLLVSAILTALTGIYFLFLPVGGFQGGRNPMYGVVILFERHTWDDLHTWAGLFMIVIAAVHLVFHWSWVINMFRRTWKEMTGQCGCMNARGRWNLILNAVVGISFVLSAVSGIYFLYFPGGRGAVFPDLVFTRSTWDLIHTWAGIALIAAALLHFMIHWKWVAKVSRSIYQGFFPEQSSSWSDPRIAS
jgi:hypothetical protein